LFQLLDLKEYLIYFPLLKSRTKLYSQDITFKKLMEYLKKNKSSNDRYNIDWRFIPSV
jgi:hypothetical protein